MTAASVVVPVKDGEPYLEELLDALRDQGEDLEVLVIDSGSRDRSAEIARAAGVELLEVDPGEFGHGRSRNLGAERTSGDLICFLTQDATPRPGWLAAYREAFELDARVGAAYGPHLPRPGTSPMIARELTEFFATFAPAGRPVVQGPGAPTFLSNVNACYARAAWEEIRFRDVPYSEDQAFGVDLLRAGWTKVYHPGAAVLHAHDYPFLEFMRRYFDEYRGLHETIDHVEQFELRSWLGGTRQLVQHDLLWMRAHGYPPGQQLRWAAASARHHAGRKVFSALGSRAQRLPGAVRGRLSLEGRSDVVPRGDGAQPATDAIDAPRLPPIDAQPPAVREHGYEVIARFAREGPAPLLDPVPGMAERERLHIAWVIPPFGIGSGGHNIIFQLVGRLERLGHTCSLWVHDPFGERRSEWPAVMKSVVHEHFAPVAAPLHKGFEHWRGADVAVATGWQTAHQTLLLQDVRARAYLINDHEPEFFPTSAESLWAADTYRMGMYGICGSPWLRDLYVKRYGGAAGVFQYGVDHDVYHPRPISREPDTVVFYARTHTPRRGVPLGVLALQELRRRHPQLRVIVFGDKHPLYGTFPYEHTGVASAEQLSWLFSAATVGLCLSLTNYSLVPQEMLACGLPCVDLRGASAESVFGNDGPVTLAAFDPVDFADKLEQLLTDAELWQRSSAAGIEFVADHTWSAAAIQVERELRNALRVRAADASIADGDRGAARLAAQP